MKQTMSTRLIAGATVAVAVFSLSGCASYPANYGLDESSAMMIRRTCTQIMGLPSGLEFDACGGSLAETFRILQEAHLTAHADQACEKQGLTLGTVEQAKCVVTLRRSGERSRFTMDPAAVPEAQPWQSYFSMSQAQQEERAELSCAQLGLHPATSRFWHCVGDLKYAVANIRYETMP